MNLPNITRFPVVDLGFGLVVTFMGSKGPLEPIH